jgi:hypothetical protein
LNAIANSLKLQNDKIDALEKERELGRRKRKERTSDSETNQAQRTIPFQTLTEN